MQRFTFLPQSPPRLRFLSTRTCRPRFLESHYTPIIPFLFSLSPTHYSTIYISTYHLITIPFSLSSTHPIITIPLRKPKKTHPPPSLPQEPPFMTSRKMIRRGSKPSKSAKQPFRHREEPPRNYAFAPDYGATSFDLVLFTSVEARGVVVDRPFSRSAAFPTR